MTEQELYDVMVAHLQALPGLPGILQLENTRIILKGETPYMRATMLRAEPRMLTVGYTGKDLYEGIFQVDLFVPTDSGTSVVNGMVESIMTGFPRGLTLGEGIEKLHIRKSYRSTALRLNDQYHQVPVSIQWRMARSLNS